MKKKLAWLLAMCMTLQLSAVSVYAEDGVKGMPDTAAGSIADQSGGEGSQEEQQTTDPSSGTDNQDQTEDGDISGEGVQGNETDEGTDQDTGRKSGTDSEKEGSRDVNSEDQDSGQKRGNLSIELTCNLPISDVQTRIGQISAVLSKDGSEAARESFAGKDGSTGKGSADIKGLETGIYQLQISGGGFAYSQDIEIQAVNQQIRLVDMTVFIEESAAHAGTYAYGDMNGDGIVDGYRPFAAFERNQRNFQ